MADETARNTWAKGLAIVTRLMSAVTGVKVSWVIREIKRSEN
jgi:hypothetical protein